jgi:hypothetical protein
VLKVFVAILVLLVTAPAFADQRVSCSGGISPQIRGLKLGMTVEQLSHKFKGIRIGAADRQGQQEVFITFSPNPLSVRDGLVNLENSSIVSTVVYPDFEGVVKIGLAFMDEHLYSLTIHYPGEVKWRNVDEFITTISGSLGLPTTAWVEDEDRENVRNLNCNKFQLRAKVEGHQAALLLFDPSAPLVLAARKAEVEEKKRGIFKP